MILDSYIYNPRQPDFEMETAFMKYHPSINDPLSVVAWEIYQIDLDRKAKLTAIPDACADIMFHFVENQMRIYVTGSATCFAEIEGVKLSGCVFGIRFKSGAVGNFFQVSAKDLSGVLVPGQLAIFNYSDIEDKMLLTKNFEERISVIRDFVQERLENDYRVNSIVEYCVNQVINNHGAISVNELEVNSGYSIRYLRRLFEQEVGLSPKNLCEIVKMQTAYQIYNLEKQMNLADIAVNCGYYDQSICIMHIVDNNHPNMWGDYLYG